MAVATRTEQIDDLYASTWNNRMKSPTDQIFEAIPGWNRLKSKGGITFNGTGGRYLEVPLAYAKNETVTSFDKGDTISISNTEFLTVAQWEWKFVAGSIVRYFVDDAKNKSIQAHLNLANQKVDNLRDSLADKMEEYLLQSDGTGNASKDPDGLLNIVAASPTTGTVANINRASYAWWRNQTKASTGAASVYLLSDMRNLMNTCSEGKKRRMPDIIITDQTSAELYDDEVLEQKQIVNQTRGDADFLGVTYKGIPIDWSPQCTAGYMYMLSSSYFGVVSDPDINFTATEWKSIPNQVNDRVMQIAWKGNFVSKRPKSLGVLTGIAA